MKLGEIREVERIREWESEAKKEWEREEFKRDREGLKKGLGKSVEKGGGLQGKE